MKKFGLIGHPLGHSLSPQIHRLIMDRAGIDGEYALYDIPPEDLDVRLPALMPELDGFNCTIPHKASVMRFLNSVSKPAARCCAVNTVSGGRGWNTDTVGFRSYGIDLKDRKVLVFGSGGTACMMAAECLSAGAAELIVEARNEKRASEAVRELLDRQPGARTAVRVVPCGFDEPCDVVLNGSPVGMWPNGGGIPDAVRSVACSTQAVFDPVYNPQPTRLLLSAFRTGVAHVYGGLRMLVRQAVEAQRIWNPEAVFDADALCSEVCREMRRELSRLYPRKILLTGFMGAGKTTVGRLLAEKLCVPFVDMDNETEKLAHCSIPDIFRMSGEATFRKLETMAAELRLAAPGGFVMASGGGFPVSEENKRIVRTTDAVVFNLDVGVEEALRRVRGSSRPLAADKDVFCRLHAQRSAIYSGFCDLSFDVNGIDPKTVAEQMAGVLESMGE